MLAGLQEPVGLTREELKVGSAGEIAGPVGVLAVRVGKKIVVVFRPPKIAFPKSFEVTRRSGIQEIHSAAVALLRIDVVDEIVQADEPLGGFLVVKVHAHGNDRVVGSVVLGLLGDNLDEILSFPVSIVRLQLKIYDQARHAGNQISVISGKGVLFQKGTLDKS